MPFTPFHFGPGALIKAAAPRDFSFSVFVFSQVLIDVEPLAFWVFTGVPVHPYLHTVVGATLVAALSYWPGRRICERMLALWNRQMSPAQARWLAFGPTIDARAAFWGAVIGAYSHVALDGIMHSDLHPFAPWAQAQPWLRAITIDQLHLLCVATGLIGVAALIGMRVRRRQ